MTETTTAVAASTVTTKPEHRQISNYVGAAVLVVGNVLPYITPQLLVALGLSAPAVQVASTVLAALCAAYREKSKTTVITTATEST